MGQEQGTALVAVCVSAQGKYTVHTHTDTHTVQFSFDSLRRMVHPCPRHRGGYACPSLRTHAASDVDELGSIHNHLINITLLTALHM